MLLTRYYFADEFTTFEDIFNSYDHRIQKFQRGEYLCKFSQKFDRIYYIKSGMTRLSALIDNGEEKLFGFWAGGSMFPIICTEQDFNLEYSLTLQAETDVTALVLRPEIFIRILSEHPEITVETIDHYCRFCNMLLFSNATQTGENIRMRICNILYTYTQFTKERNMVHLTQNDIASLIGASRVTVARELGRMRDEGLLETRRGGIEIFRMDIIKEKASSLTR